MALPIGGFMPIPLAMMIPFMATQSMVMGDAFGRAFQYGKRKISAMSNEEFNKTSLEQQASEMFAAYKIIIGENHLRDAIAESSALQKVIINEMLLILPKFISQTGDDLFKTDIKTTPDQGGKTITGKTTTNGIITTYYSDGTTTTSGTATNTGTSNKSVTLEETISIKPTVVVNQKLVAHYENNIKILELKMTQTTIQMNNSRSQGAKNQLKNQMTIIQKEITQQKQFLANVKAGKNPY